MKTPKQRYCDIMTEAKKEAELLALASEIEFSAPKESKQLNPKTCKHKNIFWPYESVTWTCRDCDKKEKE